MIRDGSNIYSEAETYMKVVGKILLCVLVVLLVSAVSAASSWKGTYLYTGVYGKTFGGSTVATKYIVKIDESSTNTCVITISGFQTDEEILCSQLIEANSITLLFNSYSSGEVTNKYGVEIYRPNQPLLKFALEKKNGKTVLMTYWLGITDPEAQLPKPGVYFKKM